MQKNVTATFYCIFKLVWVPPCKMSGCVSLASRKHYFQFKLIQRGDPYEKKCFIEAKKTHPDIRKCNKKSIYKIKLCPYSLTNFDTTKKKLHNLIDPILKLKDRI